MNRNGHPNLARPYVEPEPSERHFAEIADTLGGMPAADVPYTAKSFENRNGKKVLRLKFRSFEALEEYFIEELIGSDLMKGSASKVIGTTLLIWDR